MFFLFKPTDYKWIFCLCLQGRPLLCYHSAFCISNIFLKFWTERIYYKAVNVFFLQWVPIYSEGGSKIFNRIASSESPKIWNTKLSEKLTYANSSDSDQTAPKTKRSSLIRIYTVCHSTMYFKQQEHKNNIQAKIVWNKVFEILGHLLYIYSA